MRDFPQRHSATVLRPTSISLQSWSCSLKGPRTSRGPSRYGVMTTSSSMRSALPGQGVELRLRAHLGEDALEAGLGVGVDVRHRGGGGRVDGRDLPVHLVGDRAVRRVALASGAQLDEVHRLAGVEIEHEADPVAEAERVDGLALEAALDEPRVLRS